MMSLLSNFEYAQFYLLVQWITVEIHFAIEFQFEHFKHGYGVFTKGKSFW